MKVSCLLKYPVDEEIRFSNSFAFLLQEADSLTYLY